MMFPELLFISLRWIDVVDILLVAVLLYQLYSLVRGTAAVNIFIGILLIYLLWVTVKALDMQLFSGILGKFIDVGVITLVVVFQPEIRKFLLYIGTTEWFKKGPFKSRFFNLNMRKGTSVDLNVQAIVKACKNMAEEKTGALIVISRGTKLNFYEDTGDEINAEVSSRLLENIFFKNSPLHDGAVIISDNKIKAARCVLPVTEQEDFPPHLGMRHRAAVGVTEVSDAIAIVVSEQTGFISYSIGGQVKQPINPDRLKDLLERDTA